MKDAFDRTRCQLAICLLVIVGPISAGDKIGETVGMAYDLETDEFLYSETHCVSEDSAKREVLYEDAEGKLMASKLVDYSSGATTPSFVQHNLYSGEFIEVGFEQGLVSMAITDADSREILKSAQAQPSQKLPIVIDAGFDSFVRQEWDSLVAGDSHEFQFPLADRETLVELRIEARGCSYSSQTDQCFRLDVANWLLRILVKPIELGYDKEARRLTRFRGLSNIGDANGKGLVVDIKYDYLDSNPEICQNRTSKSIANNNGQTSSIKFNSRATALITRQS